jgi:hypothetical protein
MEKARFERANSMRPHLQCGAFDQLSHFSLFMLPTVETLSTLARGYPLWGQQRDIPCTRYLTRNILSIYRGRFIRRYIECHRYLWYGLYRGALVSSPRIELGRLKAHDFKSGVSTISTMKTNEAASTFTVP